MAVKFLFSQQIHLQIEMRAPIGVMHLPVLRHQ
jgi:hypothetical protein